MRLQCGPHCLWVGLASAVVLEALHQPNSARTLSIWSNAYVTMTPLAMTSSCAGEGFVGRVAENGT